MKRFAGRMIILGLFLAVLFTASLTAYHAGQGAMAAPEQVKSPGFFQEEPSQASQSPTDLLQATGKLTLLRVHELGDGYGPPSDFIDVEVVIKLNTMPANAFGFQLRNDNNLPLRQGMLDLLRDAFNNNWTVTIDYEITPGLNNGVIVRTWLTK